jgi:hypothetical protein
MSFSQGVFVLLILVIVYLFITIWSGRYKPPKYPGFGQ